jgi:endonuclease/exonuclease/phosphatase family metal-dependent hydrolase
MTNNKAMVRQKKLYDENLKKVKAHFKMQNPDIIALQEIDYHSARSYYANQQDSIAKIGYNYVAKAINWDKKYLPFPYWPPSMQFGEILSGQSILSKYPLSDQKRVILKRVDNSPFYRDLFYLDRLAQIVTVHINNKDIILINVHLEAFDKPTRLEQMDFVIDLFEQLSQENPVILLGDFNSDSTNDTAAIKKIFFIKNIGYAALGNTFDYTFDSENPYKRIDYIFYTKNSIEMVDSQVLKEFGQISDHLPVTMQFRIKKEL